MEKIKETGVAKKIQEELLAYQQYWQKAKGERIKARRD